MFCKRLVSGYDVSFPEMVDLITGKVDFVLERLTACKFTIKKHSGETLAGDRQPQKHFLYICLHCCLWGPLSACT